MSLPIWLSTISMTLVPLMLQVQDPVGQAPEPWAPAEALLEELGPEVETLEYGLRIPRGYRAVPPKGERDDLKFFVWGGPKREAPNSTLVVIIHTLPDRVANAQDDETKSRYLYPYNANAYHAYKGSLQQVLGVENWDQTELEEGTVSGIPFTRIRWTGDSSRFGKKFRGFYYVAQDGDKLITINSFDSDEHVVNVREASVLTFRKR